MHLMLFISSSLACGPSLSTSDSLIDSPSFILALSAGISQGLVSVLFSSCSVFSPSRISPRHLVLIPLGVESLIYSSRPSLPLLWASDSEIRCPLGIVTKMSPKHLRLSVSKIKLRIDPTYPHCSMRKNGTGVSQHFLLPSLVFTLWQEMIKALTIAFILVCCLNQLLQHVSAQLSQLSSALDRHEVLEVLQVTEGTSISEWNGKPVSKEMTSSDLCYKTILLGATLRREHREYGKREAGRWTHILQTVRPV